MVCGRYFNTQMYSAVGNVEIMLSGDHYKKKSQRIGDLKS